MLKHRAGLVALALAATACTQAAPPVTTLPPPVPAPGLDLDLPAGRGFRMGFTDWPYDFDDEAVAWTFDTAVRHSDIVAIHLDTGVPWNEAASGEPYPDSVRLQLESKADQARRFPAVYLAATPLAGDRASLAGYWGDAGTQRPLPPEWEGRTLDDPAVIEAYLAHSRRLLDLFQPEYFAYAIEANFGYLPNTSAHEGMLALAAAVYPVLKAEYPDTVIMLTFQTDSSVADPEQLAETTASLLPFTDVIGISSYPYLDLADPLQPSSESATGPGRLAAMAALDPAKPIAVTETAFIAEELIVEELGMAVAGTAAWQAEYAAGLLAEAASLDTEFVVWWEVRDYDEGYEFLVEVGVTDPLILFWRDVGMYDGDGVPRPSLGVWEAWRELPLDG